MQKIYKEYVKAQSDDQSTFEPLDDLMAPPVNIVQASHRTDRDLTMSEKKYLLATERGDIIKVRQYLEDMNNDLLSDEFDKNAVDPLGRNALHIAIEYENLEMIELLLNFNVESGEAILHAINEEFVEAVEMLLNYEDNGGNLDGAQNENAQDQESSNYPSDHPLYHAARKALLEEKVKTKFNKHEENAESKSKWSFLIDVLTKNRKKRQSQHEMNFTNPASKSFTPDITPLILASHKDNYEIIKILLDRGAQIMEPHDVRCSCQDCIKSRSEDSLRYSKSRINAYRALASPSLISLSSKDPILTAFQLSWELKRLSRIENEFKKEYEILSQQCQEYAGALLAETRTSEELEIILNHDHENPPALFENEPEKASLSRLKLAVKYKQKKFVAHPHCQQLLVALWYDGISSYRRRNIVVKTFIIFIISLIFPILSLIYLIFPYSKFGKILRQPFIKFISHSASYILFLSLLICASLRIKSLISEEEQGVETKEMRGPVPTSIEWCIFIYVASFIWSEIKQLYGSGIIEYLNDWWNLLDFTTNSLYITTIVLKLISYMIVQAEMSAGNEAHAYKREKWDPWDPTLISEGIFAIANIFSSLKLVYVFTINPHLGPLQISLGRMIFDIMKFVMIIILVMFAFSAGLNQLYWYYAQIGNEKCAAMIFDNAEDKEECFLKVKYFANFFETLQTLYWGIFGYVEKDRLEFLYRDHTFTMFIGLLIFGSYCCIMIIVLVNMLIAMMNSSYQIIANQSDEEWKFARSKLWLSYFEEGNTLPSPFNLIPSPKSLLYSCQWIYQKIFCGKKLKRKQARWLSIRKVMKKISEREYKYNVVIKELVKRYIMRKQQRDLNAGVTEDDLNEIKQDIAGFRFELLEIFKNNQFKVDVLKQSNTKRKRGKLNLEKAMNKNMFKDPDNKQNFFESMPFKKLNQNDVDLNLLKKSYQQSVINATLEAQSRSLHHESQSITLVQETSKHKGKVQIVDPTSESAPAMYKIAMKLKRLTEEKLLKKQGSVDSRTSQDPNHELKPCIKKIDDECKKNLVEENLLANKNVNVDEEKNAPKATPDEVAEISQLASISVEDFTERITEV